MHKYDVIIIGAGPAGSCAAAILNKANLSVCIIEKSVFPRFSIGESLLSQNMVYIKEAGFESVFNTGKYPKKNGAQFLMGDISRDINFADKFSEGPFETYQVLRSEYDKDITDILISRGVDIKFNHEVACINVNGSNSPVEVTIKDLQKSEEFKLESKFIIDASGLAKVLPKAIGLKSEYTAANRSSYFSHIKTEDKTGFDNKKILITVDETNRKNWFWTIPLGGNKYSLGLISEEDFGVKTPQECLEEIINRNPTFKNVLTNYKYVNDVTKLSGYTCKTEESFGNNFVLIGNSAEFLDPIFSSGITVALKSASLASNLIIEKLRGREIDWQISFIDELNYGLQTFSYFVESWYETQLQEIIFAKISDKKITSMIVSILAGYAWDKKNPYTQKTKRRLKALTAVIQDEQATSG